MQKHVWPLQPLNTVLTAKKNPQKNEKKMLIVN